MGRMNRVYSKLLIFLNMPVVLADFFSKNTGKEYNVGFFRKLSLVRKMRRNNKKILSASNYMEHLAMATKILKIPKSVQGDIVECGCYKGGSTANLSLVSALSNRKLQVFDSFEGLPEPSEHDKEHLAVNLQQRHIYSKGTFCGNLDEVKKNITKYGSISVCSFHVGYFEKTLPQFSNKCSFIFLDVDLIDSLQTCLANLWPLLQDGCCLFTHEATHLEMASLFFDREWWQKNFNSDPPGLIGAGNGLGLMPSDGPFGSDVGYTIKNPNVLNLKESVQK
jgi:O-methyltransferase